MSIDDRNGKKRKRNDKQTKYDQNDKKMKTYESY